LRNSAFNGSVSSNRLRVPTQPIPTIPCGALTVETAGRASRAKDNENIFLGTGDPALPFIERQEVGWRLPKGGFPSIDQKADSLICQ